MDMPDVQASQGRGPSIQIELAEAGRPVIEERLDAGSEIIHQSLLQPRVLSVHLVEQIFALRMEVDVGHNALMKSA